jgi:hypothetical protein
VREGGGKYGGGGGHVGAGRCRHGFSSVHRDHKGCTERGEGFNALHRGHKSALKRGEGRGPTVQTAEEGALTCNVQGGIPSSNQGPLEELHCLQLPFMYSQKRFSQASSLLISNKIFKTEL